jgi:uncharacterized protein
VYDKEGPMIVGTLRVRLLLREARTLKDKRQVVKSIKDKLQNHFNIAVAEVEALDQPRLAVLGVAAVGTEAHPLKQTLGQIVEALRCHPVAELLDSEVEV